MAKVNFKCFGDNIFSVISPSILKYTTLPIDKDSFITQIKNGLVQYSNIELRKETPINFQSDYYCTSIILSHLQVVIPDDKESFVFTGEGLTIVIELRTIDCEEIALHMRDMVNDLTKAFVKDAVAAVEKTNKQAPGFWENITEKMYGSLLDGMRLSLKNVKVVYKHKDDLLEFTIEEIDYSQIEGVTKVEGFKWVLKSEVQKEKCCVVIDRCSLGICYDKEKHLMEFMMQEIKVGYDRRIYEAFDRWKTERQSNVNRVRFYKKKLLINYNKKGCLKDGDGKYKDYRKLWHYAIRGVIHRRRYPKCNEGQLYDLNMRDKEKIAKEYYNRSNEDSQVMSDVLMIKSRNLLELSKGKVKEVILSNKSKGPANPLMAFLFKKQEKGDDNAKPSLSIEELTLLNEFYSKESIEKYLSSRWYKGSFLEVKYDILMDKLTLDFTIENLHLNLTNNNETLKLSIVQWHLNILQSEQGQYTSNYTMHIKDIVSNSKNDLIQGKTKDNILTIQSIEYDEEYTYETGDGTKLLPSTKVKKNTMLQIDFGFNEMILNKELIISIVNSQGLFIEKEERWTNVLERANKRIKKKKTKKVAKDEKGEYQFGRIPHVIIIDKNTAIKGIIHGMNIDDYNDIDTIGRMYLIDIEIQEMQSNIILLARTIIQMNHERNIKTSQVKYALIMDEIALGYNEIVLMSLIQMKQMTHSLTQSNTDRCIKMNNQQFLYDIHITKITVAFIEQAYRTAFTINQLKLLYQGNTIQLTIDESLLTSHVNSRLLHLLSNQPTSNSIMQQHQPSNLIITIEIRQIIVDLSSETFTLQSMTTRNKLLINTSPSTSITFTSQKHLITHYDKQSHSITNLLTMLQEFNLSYTGINNTVFIHTKSPLISLTPSILHQLSNCIPQSNHSKSKSKSEAYHHAKSHLLCNIRIPAAKVQFNKFALEIEEIILMSLDSPMIYSLQCNNLSIFDEQIKLITEKKIMIDMNLGNYPKEIGIGIQFTSLKISLLQKDITNIINALDYKDKLQPKQKENNDFHTFDEYIALSHTSSTIIKVNLSISTSEINFCVPSYQRFLTIYLQSTSLLLEFNGEAVEYQATIAQIQASFIDSLNNYIDLLSVNPSSNKDGLEGNSLIDYETKPQMIVKYKERFCEIEVSLLKIILRIDVFICMNAYFSNAIPVRKIYNQVKELKAEMKVKCTLAKTVLVLQTSFDNKENFYIQIDKMNSIYQNTALDKFPFGKTFVEITSLLGEFVEQNKKRKLIHSKSDFLLIKIHLAEEEMNMNVMLYKLSLSLSYKDIISFLKAYHLNMYYMKNETRFKKKKVDQQLQSLQKKSTNSSITDFFSSASGKDKTSMTTQPKPEEQQLPSKKYTSKISFETQKSEIILIDNSNNSYSPFLNFIIEKLDCLIENNHLLVTFSPSLYCYNYISCNWEPTLEPVPVRLTYVNTNFQEARKEALTFLIEKDMLINLSDMNISLVLRAFKRWMAKYQAEHESFDVFFKGMTSKINKNNKVNTNDLQASSDQAISNNKVYNCTGDFFDIHYQGHVYKSSPDSKIDLEYLPNDDDESKSRLDINKTKEIQLVYKQWGNEEHRLTCPIDKIGTRIYRMGNASPFHYYVSEIWLTHELAMEIRFYSPLVFHNKTSFTLTIVFKIPNEKEEDHIMILDAHTRKGLPFKYYTNGIFSFSLNYFDNNPLSTDSNTGNDTYKVAEIMSTNFNREYCKSIMIDKRQMQMKMIATIANVRQVVISFEYIIVNCLPCSIIMVHNDKETEIPKNAHWEIDFKCNRLITFIIMIGKLQYQSMRDGYFNKNEKEGFITFINKETATSFQLPMLILNKPTQTALVIYADYLLKNISGILIAIESKSRDKNPLAFKISQDVYLLSSNTDMKGWFALYPNGDYKSDKISLKELLSKTSDLYLHITPSHSNSVRSLDLNIRTYFSHLPKTLFNETNILTTCIISIQPICQIYNLMEDKAIFICSSNHKEEIERIAPLSKQGFHFFHRGQQLKFRLGIGSSSASCPSEWSEPFNISQFNYYTCCLQMSIFNVEMRQNTEENITDIFVFESTEDNSKTIIDNQTDFEIIVHPLGQEYPYQKINPKSKEQYRLYSSSNTVISYIVNTIMHHCDLKYINEPHCEFFSSLPIMPSGLPAKNDLVLYTESNGFKTHLIFYEIDKNEQMLPEASCRFLDLNFASVMITLIGDNEAIDKKLRNYTRNEIVLIDLKNVTFVLFERSNRSLLNKKTKDVSFKFGGINVYNQLSSIGKFATVFSNDSFPAFEALVCYDYYPMDHMMVLNNLSLKMKEYSLGIDPNFIEEIILFLRNIIYRMNLKNFDVDDVFLDYYLIDPSSVYYKEQLIKDHKSNSISCCIKNIELPSMHFTIELSKIGLKKLLRSQFNFSSMASSILSNLAGEAHPLKLNKMKISYSGALSTIVSDIRHRYHRQIVGQFHGIGFKGLLMGLASIFKQKEQESTAVMYERVRLPRAFYGRFKGFQRYDNEHAVIVDNLREINAFGAGYHFVDGLLLNSGSVVFTTMIMVIFDVKFHVVCDINYALVKETRYERNKMLVVYNQYIDGKDMIWLSFEDEEKAEMVCGKLKSAIEEYSKEFDNLN